MKWVCAVDFLLFDFPIWISAGWMDALLLLLQLRNSLSEFGPVVIRLPSSSSSSSLPSHFICRASVTWEPAHTQNTNYYTSFCQLLQGTFKHGLLHEAQLTITPKGLFFFFFNGLLQRLKRLLELDRLEKRRAYGRGQVHGEAFNSCTANLAIF